MIRNRKKPYKPQSNGGNNGRDRSRQIVKTSLGPLIRLTSLKLINLTRSHRLTQRTISLSARLLASQIGYLTVKALPTLATMDSLPTQSFGAGEIIPCGDTLCLVKQGIVHIRHLRHKYAIKQIGAEALFGEMPLLGQTMLMAEAVAGDSGAVIATINAAIARDAVSGDPASFIEIIGPRLALSERDHFRCQFQLHDSIVANALMRLANGSRIIEGVTQEELAESIGIYRETVNLVLSELKSLGLIDIQNKAITVLDKTALRELSEL